MTRYATSAPQRLVGWYLRDYRSRRETSPSCAPSSDTWPSWPGTAGTSPSGCCRSLPACRPLAALALSPEASTAGLLKLAGDH